jgi:hypothetical protein
MSKKEASARIGAWIAKKQAAQGPRNWHRRGPNWSKSGKSEGHIASMALDKANNDASRAHERASNARDRAVSTGAAKDHEKAAKAFKVAAAAAEDRHAAVRELDKHVAYSGNERLSSKDKKENDAWHRDRVEKSHDAARQHEKAAAAAAKGGAEAGHEAYRAHARDRAERATIKANSTGKADDHRRAWNAHREASIAVKDTGGKAEHVAGHEAMVNAHADKSKSGGGSVEYSRDEQGRFAPK